MDIETRINLITKEPIEEVVTLEDLRKLLETKTKITAYDGFETSGLMHLGSGVLRAIKINDLFEANVNFILLIADWYAWINNKMGGDLDLIKKTGEYFIEGWKACGIDIKKVKVMWASELVKDPEYWKNVIKISKLTTIQRAIRAGTIMGREEGEMQYVAQVLYPMMQAYDPFYLGADIMQLGTDQRKAMILTREVAPKIDGSIRVAVMHHLLIGLQGKQRMGPAESKMSKSVAESAIFIHDNKDQITKKINNAFCPPKVADDNPILEIWRYIIFRKFKSIIIKRKNKTSLEVQSYNELEKAYKEGELHPADLKIKTIEILDEILEPIRNYFEKNKKAKELYELVKSSQITR
ncbi:MAG: tyrosine--tRNA ligase [Candidatus Aenigmatarchaeota archaeon]